MLWFYKNILAKKLGGKIGAVCLNTAGCCKIWIIALAFLDIRHFFA
jgi:hypothetical protein